MLKPKLTIKTNDATWRARRQEVEALHQLEVRVGVFEEEGSQEVAEDVIRELVGDEGLALFRSLVPKRATLAEIAVFNELGTRAIPARPFIATGMARADVDALLQVAVERILEDGSTALEEGQRIADALAQSVRDALTEGPWAPNARMTVALKGSSQPLINTGRLRDAIKGKVFETGERGES